MATTPHVRRALTRLFVTFVCILTVAECANRAERDTAQTLAGNPERLKIALHQCWTDPARMDDKLCAAASEAWRRRFFEGKKMREPSPLPEVSSATDPPAVPTPWMVGS